MPQVPCLQCPPKRCFKCYGEGHLLISIKKDHDKSRKIQMKIPCHECQGAGRLFPPCPHCHSTRYVSIPQVNNRIIHNS